MMQRIVAVLLLICSTTLADVSPKDVRASIDRGVAWLYTKQNAETGSWETLPQRDPNEKPWSEQGAQWGRTTAIAAYSLLCAGEQPHDERLAKAIEFLKKAEFIGVYPLSIRISVYSKLPRTHEIQTLIAADVKKLLAAMKTTGPARGLHDYLESKGTNYNHLCSAYAASGLWSAAEFGVEIPTEYWKLASEAWIRNQDPNGGWSYAAPGRADHAVTPLMTVSAIASLFMAQDFLTFDANIKSTPVQESLNKGVKWLSDNFEKVATDERFDKDFPYMTLYGIERVATASGLRYLGTAEWYDKIAEWLLKHQRPTGGWHRQNTGGGSVNDTAFAIITLARGRAPIAMSKLDYSDSASTQQDWNLRPRDAANLTRFMGKSMEREVNFQVVTIDSPIEDWHDAPILYIEGAKALTFSDERKAKLREFVERGGLIVAAADASSKVFAESTRKLGAELFPGREWRELPAEHGIFTSQQFPASAWKSKPIVLGLDNGVRELMILLPFGDPPRWWQSNNTATKEEFWQLGTNLFQYAAGKENLQVRGENRAIKADESITPARKLKVARIKYAGNWDPEPGGWRRLAAYARNNHKVAATITAVDPAKESLSGYQLAHITGTDAVKLDPAVIRALRIFVDAGGTLLIDSAGGSSAFAGAMEPVFREFFIEAKPEPLPADHPMLVAGGKPIDIKYRLSANANRSAADKESPLQCVKFKGRVAIIFSKDDLSAALVGNQTDGIKGYAPETAMPMVGGLVNSLAVK